MQLSFWAKADQLVPVPGYKPAPGTPPAYVGRTVLPVGETAGFPAVAEPFTCDSESEIGRRLLLLACRDACLIPADAATARACGVVFKAHELRDGVMVPAASKSSSS